MEKMSRTTSRVGSGRREKPEKRSWEEKKKKKTQKLTHARDAAQTERNGAHAGGSGTVITPSIRTCAGIY